MALRRERGGECLLLGSLSESAFDPKRTFKTRACGRARASYFAPMQKLYLIDPGPRPPSYEVAQELWGGRDYDSDGDSQAADDSNWTELTVSLRPDCVERIDIDPIGTADRLVLRIVSENGDLVRRAPTFLLRRAGGSLSASPP